MYDKLSQFIITSPDIIQFAKDRKYEEAWIIDINALKPSSYEIKNYISREEFSVVIVEYIWNSSEDDKRFVLTLFLDKNCKLQDAEEFITVCLEIFYAKLDFNILINKLDQKVIGRKYLLQNKPDSVNMSIFNHWLSVGPVDLWKRGEKYERSIVIERIKNRLDIERTNLNYQGLLFRFNTEGEEKGPFYGLKTPCCIRRNGFWIIDFEKVDYWIRTLLNISV